MTTHRLPLQTATRRRRLTQLVAKTASRLQLEISSEGSLKTRPGSIHWHLKKPKRSGTLEITYDVKRGELLVQVHDNRDGGWAKEISGEFARLLSRGKLKKLGEKSDGRDD